MMASSATAGNWQIWFIDSGRGNELQGGIFTLDSQLRASIRRLTNVVVSQKTVSELETVVDHIDGFAEQRITLISHVDALSIDELIRLRAITGALRTLAQSQGAPTRPVHFSMIHRDPTSSFSQTRYSNDTEDSLLERLNTFEATFDKIVCVGPRMYAHLTSQWPHWKDGRLLQLGAGMLECPPPLTEDEPILRSMPRKSNVRVLFGSPTTPKTMNQRGLDVFARAAGLVQARFIDRHVDVTFVVSGIEPDLDATTPTYSASDDPGYLQELVEIVERALVDLAKEVFDGNIDFEVRLQQDRTAWLQHELDRADIFVLPSRDEPFGLVAAEALSKGKPVIVSQNSGIGEALLDFAADSFLPVEDYVCALTPAALAQAIVTVIEDGRSRRLFHHIARGVYPRLSWGNAVHQLLNSINLPAELYKPAVEITEAAAARIRGELPGAGWQESMVFPMGQRQHQPNVRFNVPIAAAEILAEFDTNKGRRVTLETSGSTLFVRKTGIELPTTDDSFSIPDTKRHWTYIGSRLRERVNDPALREIYPRLYDAGADEQLVMEYIDGGSIDCITSMPEAERLARLAVSQLLWAAQTIGRPGAGPTAWEFCRSELDARCLRLEQQLDQLSDSARGELGLSENLIQSCRDFFASRALAASDDPPIAVAIHGDFMMNNVVVKSDALHGDRIVFIDTRARWDAAGVPRWDTALDLGSFYFFTVAIQPTLVNEFGFGVPSPLHGQAALLTSILEMSMANSGHEPGDPGWRRRVEAACAIRSLGSISAQLTSARSNQVQRARRIADLTEEFLSCATPIEWLEAR